MSSHHNKSEWTLKEIAEWAKDGSPVSIPAIPFEINRAKSNGPDWQEYIDNKALLLADEEIEKYNDLFHPDLTNNRDEAWRFAQKTFNRVCRIYNEIHDLLSPVDSNNCNAEVLLGNDMGKRRARLLDIAKGLGGKIYFVCNDKEYLLAKNEDWARPWLSTGIITDNGYYAAVTMEIQSKDNCPLGKYMEIGLRRMPGLYDLTGEFPPELLEKCKALCHNLDYSCDNGSWWHIEVDIPLDTPDTLVAEYLRALGNFASSVLR